MKTLNLIICAITLAGCGGGEDIPLTPPTGGSVPVDAPDLGASPPTGHDGGVVADDMAKRAPADMVQPLPTKKELSFVWQGEAQGYYCGPSATRMALSTRMASPPSQNELASYMGTTTNGTDDISLVRGALDHYLGITSYAVVYLANDPPSQAQQTALKQQLVASIDAGYGMVANIVAGWRPSFYPQSGTIYHYIALVGYDAGGDKVLVADPAATGCGDGLCGNPSSAFYNVPKSYWINTSDLGVWITPKGYTYRP